MKKLLIISAGLMFIASCGKFEDGPAFSLKTKKSRLCGEWEFEAYSYNDIDETATFQALLGSGYELAIEKDGGYHVEGQYPDAGTWELGEDGDDVRMMSDDTGAVEISYRILRLKSKELWLRHTETSGDISVIKYKGKD